MRKTILLAIIVAGVACLWFVARKEPVHRLTVRTYLRNAQGVRPGTRVRVDGVDMGPVSDVRLDAKSPQHPVEVCMTLGAASSLIIPSDATASVGADGVLGPTIVEIETDRASGPPVNDNGVLRSTEISDDQAAHALEVVGNALLKESKRLQEKGKTDLSVDHGH